LFQVGQRVNGRAAMQTPGVCARSLRVTRWGDQM